MLTVTVKVSDSFKKVVPVVSDRGMGQRPKAVPGRNTATAAKMIEICMMVKQYNGGESLRVTVPLLGFYGRRTRSMMEHDDIYRSWCQKNVMKMAPLADSTVYESSRNSPEPSSKPDSSELTRHTGSSMLVWYKLKMAK